MVALVPWPGSTSRSSGSRCEVALVPGGGWPPPLCRTKGGGEGGKRRNNKLRFLSIASRYSTPTRLIFVSLYQALPKDVRLHSFGQLLEQKVETVLGSFLSKVQDSFGQFLEQGLDKGARTGGHFSRKEGRKEGRSVFFKRNKSPQTNRHGENIRIRTYEIRRSTRTNNGTPT